MAEPPVTILAIERQGGLPQFLMERMGSLHSFAHRGDSVLENRSLGIALRFPRGLRSDFFESVATQQLVELGFPPRHFVFIRMVFFDYNSALIRNDASAELDKLAELMLSYPFAEVACVVHTDSRGSSVYNKKLAGQRGAALIDYLAKAGVNTQKLNAHTSGEDALVRDCLNQQDCDEQIHQFNRRAEFVFQPMTR
ncbi:MAG: OmpA family protein [Cyclobacteriaceae bacterium]|nr:OmpA family protein [Cyclobacteriaceae bacterium]